MGIVIKNASEKALKLDKINNMCYTFQAFVKKEEIMNLKRIFFGLFMTVFTLCGCVSTVKIDAGDQLVLRTKTDIDAPEEFQVEVETVVTTSDSLPAMVYADYDGGEGIEWIASYVEGTPETIYEDFFVTRNDEGEVISKTPVLGSKRVEDAVAPMMKFGGSVTVGSEFYPRMTSYGVDCVGCGGAESGYSGTAGGASVGKHSVMQPNGEWTEGITYGGYYIVAADPSIPFCSILTVYDHGFSGEGLTPGVPFQAIVMDRGGAIRGAKIDLFIGSESEHNMSINYALNNPKIVIERVGGRSGSRTCAV